MTERKDDYWRECGSCPFWQPIADRPNIADTGIGECRAEPPRETTREGQAVWPITTRTEWCGNHPDRN